MLNTLYVIQAKLAVEGTSIDNIIALSIGLVVFMIVGYLVECNNSEKENKNV